MKTIEHTIDVYGEKCKAVFNFYTNDRLAIQYRIINTGEPMGTLTVNVPGTELEEGEFLIKDWSENEFIAREAMASGAFVDTKKRIQISQFVSAKVWRFNLDVFPPASFCSECGGKCCQKMPGSVFPNNIPGGAITKSSLKAFLSGDRYCIDYWEGDFDESGVTYPKYIRPCVKGKEGEFIDPAWGGECTFLTVNGCQLSFEERPYGCKTVEPRRDKDGTFMCEQHLLSDKVESIKAWLPYQKIIEEIIEEGVDNE